MPLDPVSSGDPHVPAHNLERETINDLQTQLDGKISLPSGAATGDLLRWDGTDWVTTETRFFEGSGDPNNVVAAPVGSKYVDVSGTDPELIEYIKRSGGGGNTGWVATGGVPDTDWLAVGSSGNSPFGNGWANYAGAYTKAAYRKRSGVVYLRGFVTRGALARNTVIFNLPPGFRVDATTQLGALVSGNVSSDLSGVTLNPTGDLIGRPTSAGNISLDGISFIPDTA